MKTIKLPHLNGQQFYHVSPAQLNPGDVVKPGKRVGKWNYDYDNLGESRQNWVFMSPSEHVDPSTHEVIDNPREGLADKREARAWEWQASYHTNRMYVVESNSVAVPADTGWEDTRHKQEYVAKSAKVVRSIDIPHPDYEMDDAVQGQLPGVDWAGEQNVGPWAYKEARARAAGEDPYKLAESWATDPSMAKSRWIPPEAADRERDRRIRESTMSPMFKGYGGPK